MYKLDWGPWSIIKENKQEKMNGNNLSICVYNILYNHGKIGMFTP